MRTRLIALTLALAGLTLSACGSLGELERPPAPHVASAS